MAELYDYDRAAAYLGVHPRTLSTWVADGAISYRRVGERGVRFTQADLDEYVDSHRVAAVVAPRRRRRVAAV